MTTALFYHDIFRALLEARVRYVVVGGVALNLQGVPRFTADLDVAVAIDNGNVYQAAFALKQSGLICRLPINLMDLQSEVTLRQWRVERNLRAITFEDPTNPLLQVDLLIDLPMPFDVLEAQSELFSAQGMQLRVASIDALIAMKSATGRSHDVADVDALMRIKAIKNDK